MITVFGSKTGNEELREIQSSLENQWMGVGPKTKKFEEDFAQRLRLPNFTLVNSGSNALLLAVKTLDLPPGSEIIVPSFTWISCAHAVALEGHKPVFCDVDLDTHNITSQTAEPHITSKTEAIMVVHYAGKPVRMFLDCLSHKVTRTEPIGLNHGVTNTITIHVFYKILTEIQRSFGAHVFE